jgi:hypothetical protein
LQIFATGYPKVTKYACVSGQTDPIESIVTAGKSSLSYDEFIDQYVYVWKTDKGWAGTCGTLEVELVDGETYTADFKFLK